MPSPLIVIPARFGATRLPGKPLADIAGRPMILHVLDRALAANAGPVVVATDDERIKNVVEAAGGTVVMTAPELPSGTDRTHAAAERIDPEKKHSVVVNLQGDMPGFDPDILPKTLRVLESDAAIDIATPAAPIRTEEEIKNIAVVKPVIAFYSEHAGRALYFSREPLPHGDGPRYHHIGLYAFRRPALARFVSLPPSPLELRERLEQLRALEAGMRIDMAIVENPAVGIDTPEQLEEYKKSRS